MTNHITLRTKLISLVTIILLLGFLATNILSYQISKSTIRNSLLQDELPLSSNNIYSEIQADLLKPIAISSQMANDAFLIDWIINGEQEPESTVRYLKKIKEKYQAFTSFFISNKTLQYYHFSKQSRFVSENDPNDSWFFRVRNMEAPYEINVDENVEQNHAITVFVNHRVLDYEGNFIGITGVGLGLDSVSQLVKRYQDDFNRDIYFIDTEGMIRLHSEAERISRDNISTMPGLKSIAKESLSQDRGSFTYKRDGETILLTTRYIPELKWHLMVELKESEATSEIQRSFLINLAIGFGVILLTIILISYTINIFQRRLEHIAKTDKLTGIGNRLTFDLFLHQTIVAYKRNKRPFTLLLLDLDFLKKVNDEKGHLVGDKVIQAIAQKGKEGIREADVICRWGGEEFAILLNNCQQKDAMELAEKIRISIAEASFLPDDKAYKITASFGLTEFREGDDEESLLSRADKALYKAKESGRNRTCWS